MVDINENINTLVENIFGQTILKIANKRVLIILTLVSMVLMFVLMISGLYFYAGISSLVSFLIITTLSNNSKTDKDIVLYSLINIFKFIVTSMALLTVILNLDLHKIALYFVIYLLMINSITFISREYFKLLLNSKKCHTVEFKNPSAFNDAILIVSLLLSLFPFIQNAVIIIYIIISSIINNYLLVSDVSNYLKSVDVKVDEVEKNNDAKSDKNVEIIVNEKDVNDE